MADYKLTLAEKETIILWSEADDTVQIDTFSQKLINRLRKAKERCPELYRVDEPDRYGGVYAEVPKKLLQISFPAHYTNSINFFMVTSVSERYFCLKNSVKTCFLYIRQSPLRLFFPRP